MILTNNTQGYGYKYTELSEIVKALESDGRTFKQYTETDPNTLKDYVWTILIDKDGKESKPLRGSEIIIATLSKANPAQEMGASLTYARRYSLLMALGWATEDDDAKSLEGAKKVITQKPMEVLKAEKPATKEQLEIIDRIIADKKIKPDEIVDIISRNCKSKQKFSELTEKEANGLIKFLSSKE